MERKEKPVKSSYRRYTSNDILEEANLILDRDYTVREVELATGTPRSTVFNHMKTRLKAIDEDLHDKVMEVFCAHRFVRSKKKLIDPYIKGAED